MKYFKIDRIVIDKDYKKGISNANGIHVPNGKSYFDRMGAGEIITDAPVFDYFFLESYGDKKDWEWRLQDIHSFIGTGSIITGWYISNDFKLMLENFSIAPKTHFYETRLLYKGEKLQYWIFQKAFEQSLYIDFSKSTFTLADDNALYSFKNEADYIQAYRKEYRETDRELKTVKQVLQTNYDLFKSTDEDIICSERLKQAIEELGLEGLLFSEIDYEVIVEAPAIQ
jgi:hypothetical protein